MLVREIITSALQELQLYAPGEQVAPVDIARGFQSANTMLDMWANDSLLCYATLEQSLVLVPGQAAYTLGPGGDLEFRPLRVKTGPGAAYIQDTNGNNYSVNVIAIEQWNAIGNRVISNSNFPDTAYFSAQFPVATINLFPVPNLAYTFFFDSHQELAAFPSVDVDIDFPRGYAEAVQRNLAIALEPFFPTARLSKQTKDLASKAMANIKRNNQRQLLAQYDIEIAARGTGTYNIYTDAYNNSG